MAGSPSVPTSAETETDPSAQRITDAGASLRHAVRKGLLADVRDIIRNAGPNAYSLVQDAEPPKFKMGRTVRPAWNDASEEGFSAVHVAAKHNHIDILQLLLEVNPEALNSEVARGYKDRQVKQGLTPLMVAAGNGQARAVKELASRHAAVNDTLENGNTALLLAAAKGHCAALKELLKLPKPLAVDLDTKDHNGDTALHIAVRLKSERGRAVLNMLLDPPTRPSSAFETPSVTATSNNGVNVAAANNSGVTPLMLAIRIGDTATFASLMERPQNLNLADNQGRTALHYAAMRGNLGMVKTLCEVGANPLAESQSRMLPLDEADINGRTEVRKFLLPYTNATQLVETDGFRSILNSISIVAVLIVTVTFIGMQTPPGGGSDGEGGQLKLCEHPDMPKCGNDIGYKLNQRALMAYVVLDGLSLFLAATDLLLVLAFLLPGVSKRYRTGQRVAWVWCMLVTCSLLLAASLVCAVSAFVAAAFAVVPSHKHPLLCIVCGVGGVALLAGLGTLGKFIYDAFTPDMPSFICNGLLGWMWKSADVHKGLPK